MHAAQIPHREDELMRHTPSTVPAVPGGLCVADL
jgi:hypothetical protein